MFTSHLVFSLFRMDKRMLGHFILGIQGLLCSVFPPLVTVVSEHLCSSRMLRVLFLDSVFCILSRIPALIQKICRIGSWVILMWFQCRKTLDFIHPSMHAWRHVCSHYQCSQQALMTIAFVRSQKCEIQMCHSWVLPSGSSQSLRLR